jgi:hypothetical protein
LVRRCRAAAPIPSAKNKKESFGREPKAQKRSLSYTFANEATGKPLGAKDFSIFFEKKTKKLVKS